MRGNTATGGKRKMLPDPAAKSSATVARAAAEEPAAGRPNEAKSSTAAGKRKIADNPPSPMALRQRAGSKGK